MLIAGDIVQLRINSHPREQLIAARIIQLRKRRIEIAIGQQQRVSLLDIAVDEERGIVTSAGERTGELRSPCAVRVTRAQESSVVAPMGIVEKSGTGPVERPVLYVG